MITAAKLLEMKKLGIKLKPLCEAAGLNYRNIYERIKNGRALYEDEIVKLTAHFNKIIELVKAGE